MTGFWRGTVGVLVGGTLGLWGCTSERPSQETRGFQDPVQTQYRGKEDRASTTVNNRMRDAAEPGRGGRPYDSDTAGSTALEGTGGSGRQVGGGMELGTGLADSYRAQPSTGGAGLDAGGMDRPDAGLRHPVR